MRRSSPAKGKFKSPARVSEGELDSLAQPVTPPKANQTLKKSAVTAAALPLNKTSPFSSFKNNLTNNNNNIDNPNSVPTNNSPPTSPQNRYAPLRSSPKYRQGHNQQSECQTTTCCDPAPRSLREGALGDAQREQLLFGELLSTSPPKRSVHASASHRFTRRDTDAAFGSHQLCETDKGSLPTAYKPKQTRQIHINKFVPELSKSVPSRVLRPQTKLDVLGIPVQFPFQPYSVQLALMEKVLTCLVNKQNGLLESPTGTGKTLCLLCSALAYQQLLKEKQERMRGLKTSRSPSGPPDVTVDPTKQTESQFLNEMAQQAAFGSPTATFAQQVLDENSEDEIEIPKIVYASRTHSQLAQVVKELKNTAYSPKMTILGSRAQFCINPKVMNVRPSVAQNHLCTSLVKSSKCQFKSETFESDISDLDVQEVRDIEDLISLGKSLHSCPYYMARAAEKTAEIIFLPYNYLIDTEIRNSLQLDLYNSILIFDEAHNLVKKKKFY